jgi:hypothetical protein
VHIGRESMVSNRQKKAEIAERVRKATIRPSLIGAAHPQYKPDNFIIGISGYARAGKDTMGDILVEKHGFKKFAFADKLRQVAYTLNPMVGFTPGFSHDEQTRKIGGVFHMPVFFADVIDVKGWDGYKETEFGPEMRRILQRMGTEVGREMISDSIWVDELSKMSGRIVVTDMRFPNEYDKIKSLGGKTWRVHREGVKPANPHKSEIALDKMPFTAEFLNNKTIADLEGYIDREMDRYGITGTML